MGMKRQQTGRTAAIRAFCIANPGTTLDAIKLALGGKRRTIGHDVRAMAKNGYLVREVIDGLAHYSMGKPPQAHALPPEKRAEKIKEWNRRASEKRAAKRAAARALRAAQQQPSIAQRKAAMTAPASVPAETVEEWMARGGHIEKLQSYHYELPAKLPVGLRAYV